MTARSNDDHVAMSYLNPGPGIRTIVHCSCGKQTRKGAQSMNTMYAGHMAHRRLLGLPRFDYSQTLIGEGYVAAGLTWTQWAAVRGTDDRDPYQEAR